MRSGQLTVLVMQPSAFSALCSLFISIAALGAANWPTVMEQPVINEYFLGPQGLITLLKTPDGNNTSLANFFSHTLFDNGIILATALLVGLVILFILEVIRRARMNAVPISNHEARLRLTARIAVSIVWLIFMQITLKLILPFCILATQVGIHALWSWRGFAYLGFGVALLWISLHVHVICLRLFVLRVRVFGGEEVLMQVESHL